MSDIETPSEPLDFSVIDSEFNALEVSINQDTALVSDLQSLVMSVESLGGIDRQMASTLELASPGILNTDRYPLTGYTSMPSKTNFNHSLEAVEAATESLGRRIWTALMKALTLAWRIMQKFFESLFNNDKSQLDRVAAMKKLIKDTIDAMPSTEQHAAKEQCKAIMANPVPVIGAGVYDAVNVKLGSDIADNTNLNKTAKMLFNTLGDLVNDITASIDKVPTITANKCEEELGKVSVLTKHGIASCLSADGIHVSTDSVDSIDNGLRAFKNRVAEAKAEVVSSDILNNIFRDNSPLLSSIFKGGRGLYNDTHNLHKTIVKLDTKYNITDIEHESKRKLIKQYLKEIAAIMEITHVFHVMDTYQRQALSVYVRLLKAQLKAINPKGADRE